MKAQTFNEWLAESEADLGDSLLFPDWQEWVDKPGWLIGTCQIQVEWDPTWNLETKVREWCEEVSRKMKRDCRPIWAKSAPMLHYTKSPVTHWEIRLVWAGAPGEFGTQYHWEKEWDLTVLHDQSSSVLGVKQLLIDRREVPAAWISSIIAWNGDTLTAEDLLKMDQILEPAKERDTWAGRLQDKLRELPNWPEDVTDWALDNW